MKIVFFCLAIAAMLSLGVGMSHAGTGDALFIAAAHVGSPDMLHAMMMAPVAAAARGVRSVRLEGANATEILAKLQKTFEDFKAERDKELKDIDKKLADVVQTEKVERINNEITNLQKALDETNALIAALKVGGAGSDEPLTAERREHAQAFNKWFRKGVDNGLADLEVKAALTTQSDPDGGYLVPTETEQTIDRVLGVSTVMRRLATIMPIGTNEYRKFVNMGGAGAGWVGEEEVRLETSTPKLRELIFNVMEMYANPATTQTMLDDGIIDIASWLADEVNQTFSELEGAAFVAGNGVKKPRGFLAYDTVANASYAWGKIGYVPSGHASAFAASAPGDAFISLYYALKDGYRQGAAWLTSDAVMASIRKFKDGQGNYLWAPPSDAAGVPTILNKPVYTDDNMPALGADAFPVAFGDFKKGYLIVDRQGIRVLRDPYTSKPKVQFYTTKRVGGGVSNFEALKLMKVGTS
jgi:HK97 family phage major capsid protein